MGSILFCFILLIIFIYFLINSINMENLRDVDPIGASGLPTFILFILVALLIYTLIKEVVKYKKNKEKTKHNALFTKPALIIMIITVGIAIFILVLNKMGFFLSCLFLTPLLLVLLGSKNKIQIISFSVGIPILFTFLFGNILSIPLPKGIGIFSEISNFIY
ncbi:MULTISPECIES: tripartite tricarboxylate transporter TctB family protein [Staphylococcus]|uniref:tripartite tricarboxylate transporter TctB family protein n=1 Tax=Staphylococcus TaxID=1279 RepID=UPI0024170737|nr:tripartite tricarboxylate transporter TctB family protein [Staphylococcus xylosus]MDG5479558.1 tripartite tricarboxylate transporter TctB family protein [Staphylococcus xylosus]MEB6204658.1 tripartite tricarboxylate transporter TctB family protein [Staphylococcus xylosus]